VAQDAERLQAGKRMMRGVRAGGVDRPRKVIGDSPAAQHVAPALGRIFNEALVAVHRRLAARSPQPALPAERWDARFDRDARANERDHVSRGYERLCGAFELFVQIAGHLDQPTAAAGRTQRAERSIVVAVAKQRRVRPSPCDGRMRADTLPVRTKEAFRWRRLTPTSACFRSRTSRRRSLRKKSVRSRSRKGCWRGSSAWSRGSTRS
jgi:hypothetical protein